ncbi:GNAT domain protein [Kalmanozyma brasiliensis GHG001]|uniref:GNAT domain protein n=1 Tax=Kalmanozyma brasiliensis (strain GHG001) TaxID=1365824 RepID=UPI001CEBC8B4|nr:GNAT domain protein [Kalmanozyma brasiliensis GHG001]EST04760.2 GNAT domain protein [Kalmanozyma brasiliensis GHG001]
MPRRKIGADLKEALCKLYEAGDISAETIEKHGLMSRATFFRNLKIYKTGASLEQRHSTGRKTNADKLRQHERLELDALQPKHLSHLELVLLLDDDDKDSQAIGSRNKRKGKGIAGSSKRKDATARGTAADEQADDAHQTAAESGSESEGDLEDSAVLARRQVLEQLTQASRSFLTASSSKDAAIGKLTSPSAFADLDSLLRPEDSHYSHSNRGALFIVRRRRESRDQDADGEIVAAVALRSLIWTPEIFQALGPSYANRSIDKICNLAQLRVDPQWQRKGIGQWLIRVAEFKASKLGFTHLYTQSAASRAELLSFWTHAGFHEFVRLDNVARLEKAIVSPTATTTATAESAKPSARSPPGTARGDGAAGEASSQPSLKRRRMGNGVPNVAKQQGEARLATIPSAMALDPNIPLDSPEEPFSTPLAPTTMDAVVPSRSAPAPNLRPIETPSVILQSTATSSAPTILQDLGGSVGVAIPAPTSYTAARDSNGDPRRRIAFHETSLSDSGRST